MPTLPAIHQLLPSLIPGDAISNHALALRDLLRGWGFTSEIYALHCDPAYARQARSPRQYRGDRRNLAIYHYSIGSPLGDFVLGLPDRLVLHYHNITPPALMGEHNPRFRDELAQGRAALPAFRRALASVADSDYNAQDLVALGFERVETIPVIIDFARLDRSPTNAISAELRDRLGDDRANLLYVGRIVPNKRQLDLIALFAYYQRLVNPHSRLLLAGSPAHAPSYQLELETYCQVTGVQAVEFLGQVSDADLAFCYRNARVYVSMSEHEGFGVPLLEAMHSHVPVLAYAAAAVPYTLGDAGILCHYKRYDLLAEMIDLLAQPTELRKRVIQRQLQQLAQYDPQLVATRWHNLVTRLLDSGPADI